MLHRISVIGAAKALGEAIDAAPDEVELVTIKPKDDLPQGTAAVAGATSKAPELLRLALEQARRNHVLLQLFAEAVDAREGMLTGSARRLEAHATRFAQALELDNAARLTLERGALLRDIGKIRIANDVLMKNSVLTYDEWILLQQHTHLGAQLLQELDFATDVIEIVRHHHESYDGDGYPSRLEGEAIPLLARAMKILDSYCAMTSPRHYRATHSTHEEAIAYLESERGKHFDPALVDVFIQHNIGEPWNGASTGETPATEPVS